MLEPVERNISRYSIDQSRPLNTYRSSRPSPLKSALEKERDAATGSKKQLRTIREKLGIEDNDKIVEAIDTLSEKGDRVAEVNETNAKLKITQDIAASGGNAHVLSDKLINAVNIDPETGAIMVPGPDGVALERDDGTKKDHTDILADWKKDPLFAGNFAATKQSGGGSEPGKSGDGKPFTEPANPDAPPRSMPISEMNPEQRMLAATKGGGYENYPR